MTSIPEASGANDRDPYPAEVAEEDRPPRPQRPATLVFTQAVLALQSLAMLFATLVLSGLARAGSVDVPAGWIWGVGLGVMVFMAYVSSKQATRWGRILGWVMQAPMLAAGALLADVALIGGMFLVLWVVGLRLGGRIDRERAERLAAEQHGPDADGEAAAEASEPGESPS